MEMRIKLIHKQHNTPSRLLADKGASPDMLRISPHKDVGQSKYAAKRR